MNNNQKTFIVSFIVTQRGDKTGWIEDVIQSGLRNGETLDTLCISELNNDEEFLNDYQ